MNSDDHVRLEILRMYCDCTKSFPQDERDQRLLEDAAHFVVHGLFPGEDAPLSVSTKVQGDALHG